MRIGLTSLLIAVGLVAIAGARADVQRGQLIALQRCAVCHATEATGDSPHKITPPFLDLHQRYPIDMLVETLRTGVVEGHDEMPMFQFLQQDAEALIRYIDSLSPERARYLNK
jgi:mono/diheme cytochrome c family protein